MKTNKLEIHQDNMCSRQCLANIIIALSIIKKIIFLDINMESKIIRLKYQDDELDNNKIKYLIDRAVLI